VGNYYSFIYYYELNKHKLETTHLFLQQGDRIESKTIRKKASDPCRKTHLKRESINDEKTPILIGQQSL
jgi:hypothetical protein